uniref:Elongator complex protein 2 n=1 Tax=Palpitomonas bilix TaxID=652834 RepID=A0A7S3G6Y8_9EUKA
MALLQNIKPHTKSVTAIGVKKTCKEYVITTASADSLVRVYTLPLTLDGEVTEVQTLDFSPQMMEAVAIAGGSEEVDGEVLIALAGVDTRVHVYGKKEKGGTFERLRRLKSHKNWIQALSFHEASPTSFFLASGSQDATIHTWKFSLQKDSSTVGGASSSTVHGGAKVELTEEEVLAAALDSMTFAFSSVSGRFQWHSHLVEIQQDAALIGHEARVTGLAWVPEGDDVLLLSTSMDRAMFLWQQQEGGAWDPQLRIGEMGGSTGNIAGFIGCSVTSEEKGRHLLAYSHNGAFHLWRKEAGSSSTLYQPLTVTGGHFKEVTSLAWHQSGEYFASVSKDQTARIFGCWKAQSAWVEIARPQVHGYDLQDCAFVPNCGNRLVSAAEEKTMRVFDAPKTYYERCHGVMGMEVPSLEGDLPITANVPPLGLSNKAVLGGQWEEEQNREKGSLDEGRDSVVPVGDFSTPFSDPPVEEDLVQRTLWPEMQKLYAHGNDVFSIAVSPSGEWLASAAKATSSAQAAVRFWMEDKDGYRHAAVAPAVHDLTVTSLSFSSDSRFCLATGRDRSFSIYSPSSLGRGKAEVKVVVTKAKAHKRIIWAGDFLSLPAEEEGTEGEEKKGSGVMRIVTVSRDSTVKIWDVQVQSGETSEVASLNVGDAVTAVGSLKCAPGVFAIGKEKGGVTLCKYTKARGIETLTELPQHGRAVKKVRFSPSSSASLAVVATCSDDHSVLLSSVSL